jgi:hypothetical protein
LALNRRLLSLDEKQFGGAANKAVIEDKLKKLLQNVKDTSKEDENK